MPNFGSNSQLSAGSQPACRCSGLPYFLHVSSWLPLRLSLAIQQLHSLLLQRSKCAANAVSLLELCASPLSHQFYVLPELCSRCAGRLVKDVACHFYPCKVAVQGLRLPESTGALEQ